MLHKRMLLITISILILILFIAEIVHYPNRPTSWLKLIKLKAVPVLTYNSKVELEVAAITANPSAKMLVSESTVTGLIGSLEKLLDMGKTKQKGLIYSVKEVKELSEVSVIRWKEYLDNLVTSIHQAISSTLIGYFTPKSASLVKGMVFGGKSEINRELQDAFKDTGMLHVLSASGYNVGLMCWLVRSVTSRFCGRKIGCSFDILSVLIYVLLAGATASVIRAGCMAIVMMIGSKWFFRPLATWWALVLTVLMMVAVDPLFLGSISFQLSVLATAGILAWVFVQPESKIYDFYSGNQVITQNLDSNVGQIGKKVKEAFISSFLITVAAQSLTLPVQLFHFKQLTLISFLANPSIQWLTPLLTLGTVWFLILHTLLNRVPVLGFLVLKVFSSLLEIAILIFTSLINLFSNIKFGNFVFYRDISIWIVPVWWLAVGFLVCCLKIRNSRQQKSAYVV